MTVTLPLVRRLALASLLANIGIVLTGGAVRLTGSGLGCPTWPRCTDESWTATPEMGIHGVVEFGNRTLTFVLGAIAVAGLVAVWRLRPRPGGLVWPAAGVLVGIGAQGLIGGITVWTDLNPWIVAAHFLVSVGIITVAYVFWQRAGAVEVADPVMAPTGAAGHPGDGLRRLAWVVLAVILALLVAGTVVTGSGPHAGDPDVPRNGFDPETVTRVHSFLSYLVLGLAAVTWLVARRTGAPTVGRAAAGLTAVVLGQAALGIAQYLTGLPESLVWLHLLGACLVWLAGLHLWYATGARRVGSAHHPLPAARRGTVPV